ncbi:MAG: 30S ribosomal protein S9 [Bdellovibrionaceae bacterium]|jgi:small subunit ribosomal protein S9|nr:30S ribosomal protein S9 [Pseudobdellovibrionaceae bacterium]
MSEEIYYSTGRRKTSAARIFLKKGSGQMTVNGKKTDEYFRATDRMIIQQPFVATSTKGQFDVMITVRGGGISGQAGAIRHGISRALVLAEETHQPSLKKEGYLTRDPRMVERKKYGKKKSRKSSQFSKR